MKKCILIYNPRSGKSKKLFKNRALDRIALDYNYKLIYQKTKTEADATNIVKDLDDVDLVVAIGGDGTIHEVIEGNLKRDKQLLLGHLPQGTVNDVGKMYGYSGNIESDFKMLLEGVKKRIDVGMLNDSPFIYVACFGNFVNVSFDTPRYLKEKYGKFGYFIYALKKFRRNMDLYNIEYTTDGITRTGEFSFILITNSDRIAGFNNIYKDVKLDDDKFEVVLCKATSIKEIISILSSVLYDKVTNTNNVIYFKTDNLTVKFLDKPKDDWCLDGERLNSKSLDYTFKIDHNNEMLVPIKKLHKLFGEVNK